MGEIKNYIEPKESQIKRLTKLYQSGLKNGRVIPIGNLSNDEWLILRSIAGIGASECAATLGYVPGWFSTTPLSIWKAKVSHLIEIRDEPRLRLGKALEPIIIQEYQYLTGRKVINVKDKMFLHPELDFLFVDLDGLVEPAGGDNWSILETKATTSYTYDSWKLKLPSYYFRQCMAALAIMQNHPFFEKYENKICDSVTFVTYIQDQWQVETLPIQMDIEFIKQQTAELIKFNEEYIVPNLPPPESASEWVVSTPMEDSYIEGSEQAYKFVQEYLDLNAKINVLEERKGEVKDEIIKEIKDNEILLYQGEQVCSYKQQSRTTVDSKRLKAEKPDVYNEFKKTTTSRVIRPKRLNVLEY